MIELEIFLGTEMWNQSWLLSSVEMGSSHGNYSGTIIQEAFEKIDAETIRCCFTVSTEIPLPPDTVPSVITRHLKNYPEAKRLAPSAGTAWPTDENSEILVSFIEDNPQQPIILGTVFNHAQQDPVTNQNPSQHILRTAPETELCIDDHNSQIQFTHNKNNLALSRDVTLTSAEDIVVDAQRHIFYHSQQDMIKNIQHNYSVQAEKNITLNTQTGNITGNITHKMIAQAQESIFCTAKQNVLFQANDNFQINSSDKCNIVGEKKCQLNTQGVMTIQPNNTLTLIAENKIVLYIMDSTIEITENAITFTAPQIAVTGQPVLSVKPTGPM